MTQCISLFYWLVWGTLLYYMQRVVYKSPCWLSVNSGITMRADILKRCRMKQWRFINSQRVKAKSAISWAHKSYGRIFPDQQDTSTPNRAFFSCTNRSVLYNWRRPYCCGVETVYRLLYMLKNFLFAQMINVSISRYYICFIMIDLAEFTSQNNYDSPNVSAVDCCLLQWHRWCSN